MTNIDIIAMAREAGFTSGELAYMQDNFLFFATLVAAAERDKWMERTAILIRGEREACAKECKFGRSSADIEQAIRERSANARARGETQ